MNRIYLCKWINYKYLILNKERSIMGDRKEKNFLKKERYAMKKNIFMKSRQLRSRLQRKRQALSIIDNVDAEELREALEPGDVAVTISLE